MLSEDAYQTQLFDVEQLFGRDFGEVSILDASCQRE
jgi:hypothetical protein